MGDEVVETLNELRMPLAQPIDGSREGEIQRLTPTIDALFKVPGVKLVALFSPEHGIRGLADAEVPDAKDEATGLPIHSLYGKTRKPTPESLEGIDTLVYDIQDIGARFYTYISTLGLVLLGMGVGAVAAMVFSGRMISRYGAGLLIRLSLVVFLVLGLTADPAGGADPDAALRFYTGGLGAKLSDYIYGAT